MQQVTRFKITCVVHSRKCNRMWTFPSRIIRELLKDEAGRSFMNFSYWGASSKGICYSRRAVIIEYSAQCPWGALCEDEIFSPAQWPVVRTCWLFQQAGPTITIDPWNHFSKHGEQQVTRTDECCTILVYRWEPFCFPSAFFLLNVRELTLVFLTEAQTSSKINFLSLVENPSVW